MHARWKQLQSDEQLAACIARSFDCPQIVFKHSTRCIISKMVLKQLEDQLEEIPINADLIYLDLLAYRDLSNAVAAQLNVRHESPQIIVIKNGLAEFHESHHSINASIIAQHC